MVDYKNLVNQYYKNLVNQYYSKCDIDYNVYQNCCYHIPDDNFNQNCCYHIPDDNFNQINSNNNSVPSNALILDNNGTLTIQSNVSNLINSSQINTKKVTISNQGILNLQGTLNCQEIIVKGNASINIEEDGILNIQN